MNERRVLPEEVRTFRMMLDKGFKVGEDVNYTQSELSDIKRLLSEEYDIVESLYNIQVPDDKYKLTNTTNYYSKLLHARTDFNDFPESLFLEAINGDLKQRILDHDPSVYDLFKYRSCSGDEKFFVDKPIINNVLDMIRVAKCKIPDNLNYTDHNVFKLLCDVLVLDNDQNFVPSKHRKFSGFLLITHWYYFRRKNKHYDIRITDLEKGIEMLVYTLLVGPQNIPLSDLYDLEEDFTQYSDMALDMVLPYDIDLLYHALLTYHESELKGDDLAFVLEVNQSGKKIIQRLYDIDSISQIEHLLAQMGIRFKSRKELFEYLAFYKDVEKL